MDQRERLVEVLEELFGLSEEDRERILRIVNKYPAKKIIVALNQIAKHDKRGRKEVRMSLEEFEKHLKRVRF